VDVETAELWGRFLCGRSLSARNDLITHYLPLVRRQAARMAATLSRGAAATVEDLVQTGAMGLQRAVERFDPSWGVQFATLAFTRVPRRTRERMERTGSPTRQPSLEGLAGSLEDLGNDPAAEVAPRGVWEHIARSLMPAEELRVLLHRGEAFTLEQVGAVVGLSASRIGQMRKSILSRSRASLPVQEV
jgi:RNA polymerase sigma-B factor